MTRIVLPRRLVVVAVCLVTLSAVVIAGCSGSDEKPPTTTRQEVDIADTRSEGNDEAALQELIALYRKADPGIAELTMSSGATPGSIGIAFNGTVQFASPSVYSIAASTGSDTRRIGDVVYVLMVTEGTGSAPQWFSTVAITDPSVPGFIPSESLVSIAGLSIGAMPPTIFLDPPVAGLKVKVTRTAAGFRAEYENPASAAAGASNPAISTVDYKVVDGSIAEMTVETRQSGNVITSGQVTMRYGPVAEPVAPAGARPLAELNDPANAPS